MANGHIRTDPIANFKTAIQKVDRGFLTQNEFDTIIKKKFEIYRLSIVRDTLIFGCFTGLAYSDLKSVSPENL